MYKQIEYQIDDYDDKVNDDDKKDRPKHNVCVCVYKRTRITLILHAHCAHISMATTTFYRIIFENTLPNKSDETNKSDKNEHKQNAQQLQCNGYTKRFPR